jgi:hypothetical protein
MECKHSETNRFGLYCMVFVILLESCDSVKTSELKDIETKIDRIEAKVNAMATNAAPVKLESE